MITKCKRSFLTMVFVAPLFMTLGVLAQQGSTNGHGEVPVAHPIPLIRTYVLASPRAGLLGPCITLDSTEPITSPCPRAGVENFPRHGGSLKIAQGMGVLFRLSPATEGVWYPHSFGRVATSVVLQRLRILDDGSERWEVIGHDGAGDIRRGPSIGRAKVGVPVRFNRVGEYHLRAIVRTVAQPFPPVPLADSVDGVEPPAVVDRDIIPIRVVVLDIPIHLIVPDEPPAPHPDAVFTHPLPKEASPQDAPTNADLNGDDIVDLSDLAILTKQWGSPGKMAIIDMD